MTNDDWEQYIKNISKLESYKVFFKPRKKSITQHSYPTPTSYQLSNYNLTYIDNLNRSKIRKLQNDSIDATLDLHGLTLIQAEQEFVRFINNAPLLNNKNLLVITGKGKIDLENNEIGGKIKKHLPIWIENNKHLIKYWVTAPNSLGGDGALIIRLRDI